MIIYKKKKKKTKEGINSSKEEKQPTTILQYVFEIKIDNQIYNINNNNIEIYRNYVN